MKRYTDLGFSKIIKLMSSFVAQTTCMDCCKFFELPETADCGHTACHSCWQNRRTCKWCAVLINHPTLKHNNPLQILTSHVRNMCKVFERTFDFKVDKFSIGHMKSLQKHVAAQDDESVYEITIVKHIKSIAQVHSHTSGKTLTPSPEVVVKQVAQVNWEAIEKMPEILQINENQIMEFDPDTTRAIKRCLRRSKRLFSISLSAESVVDTSPLENLQSPVQLKYENIKTFPPNIDSNQVVKSEIEKFSDIDDLNIEQILKSSNDHTKNITEWLANSDRYLKASICSELQDIKTVTSTVQIHSDTTTKKVLRPPKVVNKKVTQNDWDKIEKMPDVNEFSIENINSETDAARYITDWLVNAEKYPTLAICSESIQNNTHLKLKDVTQHNWDKIEQLSDNDDFKNKLTKAIDDINEYSAEKPRRSSRKREFKYYAECHYYPLNIKRRRS